MFFCCFTHRRVTLVRNSVGRHVVDRFLFVSACCTPHVANRSLRKLTTGEQGLERMFAPVDTASIVAHPPQTDALRRYGSIVAFVEQSSHFLNPVLIGDTITPELEVTELIPKTDTGLLRLTTRVKNQRGEVVLEGTHAYLIKKRPRA